MKEIINLGWKQLFKEKQFLYCYITWFKTNLPILNLHVL